MIGNIVCGVVVVALMLGPVAMAIADYIVVGREIGHES